MGKTHQDDHEAVGIVEEASSTVLYLGYPAQGSPDTSAPKWAIKKVEEIGTALIITWALGLNDKTQIWDNRANYEYSFLK